MASMADDGTKLSRARESEARTLEALGGNRGNMTEPDWSEALERARLRTTAAYAREWVADCEWVEDADELAELGDAAIVAGAARHYCGGLEALERDARA